MFVQTAPFFRRLFSVSLLKNATKKKYWQKIVIEVRLRFANAAQVKSFNQIAIDRIHKTKQKNTWNVDKNAMHFIIIIRTQPVCRALNKRRTPKETFRNVTLFFSLLSNLMSFVHKLTTIQIKWKPYDRWRDCQHMYTLHTLGIKTGRQASEQTNTKSKSIKMF